MGTKDIKDRLISTFLEQRHNCPSNMCIIDKELYTHLRKIGHDVVYDMRLMMFQKSLDWLYPAIEKIESLDGGKYFVCIEKNNCEIYYFDSDKDKITINATFGNSKIEAVYNAVVEFIQWYNQNK